MVISILFLGRKKDQCILAYEIWEVNLISRVVYILNDILLVLSALLSLSGNGHKGVPKLQISAAL